MTGTVPTSVFDPHVTAWLNKFKFNTLPVHVKYDPSHKYTDALCHVNAKHAAAKLGGTRVHGWTIWLFDLPPVVAHAEFHSVVRTEDGLVDVTPPKFNAQRVLFLEDRSLTITKSGSNYIMYSELSCHPSQTYWVGQKNPGVPTWSLPESHPPLVSALSALGMHDML
jgi:hypothetical protein